MILIFEPVVILFETCWQTRNSADLGQTATKGAVWPRFSLLHWYICPYILNSLRHITFSHYFQSYSLIIILNVIYIHNQYFNMQSHNYRNHQRPQIQNKLSQFYSINLVCHFTYPRSKIRLDYTLFNNIMLVHS